VPTAYPLDYRDINPTIRIAHRLNGLLDIPRRRIFDHELVLITKVSAEFFDDVSRRHHTAGDLLVIFPLVWHGFRSINATPSEHIAVHFDFAPSTPPTSSTDAEPAAYEVRLSHGLRLPEFLPARDGRSAKLNLELAALVKEWEDPHPPAALAARSHLLSALIELLQTENSATRRPGEWRNAQRIERAIRYIEAHFSQHVDAGDLATAAGLSASQLTRLFREHTGHTPMQYLRRARIEQARRMLADVDLSIKEIAGRCGFDDPYHFSRVFHQVDGLPPTLYREALLAGRG